MQATRKEDGAVLVEFALVLVPLLFIIFGFLFVGLAMNAKIDSTHLTAEGARYTVVNQNPGDTDPSITAPKTLQKYIRSRGDTQRIRTTAAVCIEYPTNNETLTSGKPGDPVRVTMSYQSELIPFLSGLLPGNPISLNVTSEATMRLEALPTKVPAGCI